MEDVIMYSNPDGSVSIVYPTGEVPLEIILAKDVPNNASNVTKSLKINVPQDRYFRNAWKQNLDKIEVDMEKAKVVHMGNIRKVRDQELSRLDVEWTKKAAQKKNQESDDIEAKRQVLRDLPQTFDLSVAKTPDELKALWPIGLERK